MSHALQDYFAALDRLKSGMPSLIPKNAPITKDAVAVEAGRGKGSIKKSRAVFADLILAIDAAAIEQLRSRNDPEKKLIKARDSVIDYRTRLEAALAREVSLLYEVYHLKKQLA